MSRSWPVFVFGICVIGVYAFAAEEIGGIWPSTLSGFVVGLFAAPVSRWASASKVGTEPQRDLVEES